MEVDGIVCALDSMVNCMNDTCSDRQLFTLSCVFCGEKSMLGCQEIIVNGASEICTLLYSFKARIVTNTTTVEGNCTHGGKCLDFVTTISTYFTKEFYLPMESISTISSDNTMCSKKTTNTELVNVMSSSMPSDSSSSSSSSTTTATTNPITVTLYSTSVLPLHSPTLSYSLSARHSDEATMYPSNIMLGGLVGGVTVILVAIILVEVGATIIMVIRKSE